MQRIRRREPPEHRFWPKVEKTPTCWNWLGNTNGKYGGFWDGYRRLYAHRWSYEHAVGPIPDGLQLDHLCRNTLCVRPDHLQPVTNRENHRRGLRAQQTHCSHGHQFDEANTYIRSNGTRSCRTCHRDRMRSPDYAGPPTHCIHGHEFTPDNTYVRPNGTRACMTCRQSRRVSSAARLSGA